MRFALFSLRQRQHHPGAGWQGVRVPDPERRQLRHHGGGSHLLRLLLRHEDQGPGQRKDHEHPGEGRSLFLLHDKKC